MSSDWLVYRVSDLEKKNLILVQDGNHGEYRPRKNEFYKTGTAFIRAADLGLGVVQFESSEKINDEALDRIRKGIGKDLDTVLSTKGTVGKTAFVPEDSPKYVCSPQTSFWRSLNHKFIDPKYLYYEIQSRHFINQISSRKGETDMADYLSLTSQRGLSIRVPPIERQREIAHVLGSIDDKIELNRQINQTLEHIAQAIFKSWFVDFEPVKAKIQAKQNGQDPERAAMCAISGKADAELDAYLKASTLEHDTQGSANVAGGRMPGVTRQQLTDTAALFPDEFEDSDLGPIPKGWEPGTLDDVCYLNTNSWTKKNKPNEVWYVDLANTKNGVIEEAQHYLWSDAPSRARRIAKPGDTIVGTVRPGNRSFALIGDAGTQLTASTGFAVLSPKTNNYREFTYIAATSNSNIDRLAHLADGAAYPAVRPDIVTQAECVIPDESIIEKFSKLAGPLFSLREENLMQSEVLVACRTFLLPKLLSGEITALSNQSSVDKTAC